jgi:NADH:ubiquinone oxidoreductase subunit 6 (subunit J)
MNRIADLLPILIPVALGGGAIYLLLPRPQRYSPLLGGAAAGLAILSAGWLLLRAGTITPEVLLFYAFSAIAVLAGGVLVTQRNPARAALAFAVTVLAVCGLFLLQAAPFLMFGTIIIYAGSIVVTFLFVIMLAKQEGPSDADQRSREPLLAAIAGVVLLGAVVYLIRASYGLGDFDRSADGVDRAVRHLEELNGRYRDGQTPSDAERKDVLKEVGDVIGFGKQEAEFMEPWDKWSQTRTSRPLSRSLQKLAAALNDSHAALAHCTNASGTKLINDLRVLEDKLHAVDDRVHEVRETARTASSFLQPHLSVAKPDDDETADEHEPLLSELSGAAANRPADKIRRDEQGRPQMPAENVAGLGRSLFTDYLLAVELAGTLLLVATIGAIAIAMRKQPRQGSPA